jgi:hypothetical protein
MAHLFPGRALYLTAVAVAVGASVAVGAAPARGEVDLNGTWHVLVHYKDDSSPNPDRLRWDDRLWAFEPSGSRVRWMEWPIVVFSDDTGRFERRGTGQYARVLRPRLEDEGAAEGRRRLAIDRSGAGQVGDGDHLPGELDRRERERAPGLHP